LPIKKKCTSLKYIYFTFERQVFFVILSFLSNGISGYERYMRELITKHDIPRIYITKLLNSSQIAHVRPQCNYRCSGKSRHSRDTSTKKRVSDVEHFLACIPSYGSSWFADRPLLIHIFPFTHKLISFFWFGESLFRKGPIQQC